MIRRGGQRVAVAVVATIAWRLLAFSPMAHAFIPKADRTLREVAKVNQSSGRNKAIQLELTMRIAEREPVARGQLITHPSGLARLELRGFNGRVDRYLLSGSELAGAKDGLRIDRPQPLLQPLFLLQLSTSSTLRTALETFDVLSDSIGLAPCGEQDCFVIGDPRLAAPLPEPGAFELEDESALPGAFELEDESALPDPLGLEGDEFARSARDLGTIGGEPVGLRQQGALEGPDLAIPEDALLSRLWVDTENLQVRRIDRANGVFTLLGPVVSFERLMIPAWFEVHEPDNEPIRFEVDRAVQVNAPPQAFSRKWLLAPVGDWWSEPADDPAAAVQHMGAP
ncbi:MAG: hypothetical protein CL931_13035 [Deltaproteobacteria bacterium]|nr:hypothetical protein [Deltaproteobacteria bacterium]